MPILKQFETVAQHTEAQKLLDLYNQITEEARIQYLIEEDLQNADISVEDVLFDMPQLIEAWNKIVGNNEGVTFNFLGHGEFGIVFSVTHEPTICLKMYAPNESYHLPQLNALLPLLQGESFPTVYSYEPLKFCVMEYIDGLHFEYDDLIKYLSGAEKFIWAAKFQHLFSNIFQLYQDGLWLHDLNLSNIMLTDNQIKIIDLDHFPGLTVPDSLINITYHDISFIRELEIFDGTIHHLLREAFDNAKEAILLKAYEVHFQPKTGTECLF